MREERIIDEGEDFEPIINTDPKKPKVPLKDQCIKKTHMGRKCTNRIEKNNLCYRHIRQEIRFERHRKKMERERKRAAEEARKDAFFREGGWGVV